MDPGILRSNLRLDTRGAVRLPSLTEYNGSSYWWLHSALLSQPIIQTQGRHDSGSAEGKRTPWKRAPEVKGVNPIGVRGAGQNLGKGYGMYIYLENTEWKHHQTLSKAPTGSADTSRDMVFKASSSPTALL